MFSPRCISGWQGITICKYLITPIRNRCSDWNNEGREEEVVVKEDEDELQENESSSVQSACPEVADRKPHEWVG
jgi:hypothetical protein